MYTTLNIKTEKKLKKEAQLVSKKIGVPLSTVVNSFLKQFVRDQEVIFSAKEYKMTPYLESLVEEARKERGQNKNHFTSPEKMIKSLRS